MFAESWEILKEIGVVLQADESFCAQAWQAMEAESMRIRETDRPPDPAGRAFPGVFGGLLGPGRLPHEGRCERNAFPPVLYEPGLFAWAFTADGNVLPFGDVRRDRGGET